MYIKAIQVEKAGKFGVAYYRGKKLWCRIVQYDDGRFLAMTNLTGGPLVPTLELAKQRIEKHLRLIDSMAADVLENIAKWLEGMFNDNNENK